MSDFEDRLTDWLRHEARPAENRASGMTTPRNKARIGRGSSGRQFSLAPFGLAAVVLIVAAFALGRLNVEAPGSTASASPDAEASTSPSATGAVLSAEVASLLASTRVAIIDPRADQNAQWLVGTLTGRWEALPYTAHDAVVRTDWARVVVTTQGETLRIVEIDDAGAASIRFEGPATTSTVLAAGGPRGRIVAVGVDLGVVLVESGMSELVVEPTAAAEPVQRGEILWSPSGALVGSPLCSQTTCKTDVIEMATRRTWAVPDFVPLALSEDFVVGYRSEADRALLVLDLETLDVVNTDLGLIVSPYSAVALSTDRFLLSGEDAAGALTFVVVNLSGKTEMVVRTDPSGTLVLYKDWSSSRYAVLGPRSGVASAALKSQAFEVIDLEGDGAEPVKVVAPDLPSSP
jgi:hypothetical protein